MLPLWETILVEHSRNINLFVEFQSINTMSELISSIKSYDIQIYDIDIEQDKTKHDANPTAVIMLHLNKTIAHTKLITSLSGIGGVFSIKEV